MMMMRWQLAYPGKPLPVIGNALERMSSAPAACRTA